MLRRTSRASSSSPRSPTRSSPPIAGPLPATRTSTSTSTPTAASFNAYRAMIVVDEVEDPTTEFTRRRGQASTTPSAKVGDLVRIGELDANSLRPHPRPDGHAARPPAPARGGARAGLRPVRAARVGDHHRHRSPGGAARRDPRRRPCRGRSCPPPIRARQSTTASASTSRRTCSRFGARPRAR